MSSSFWSGEFYFNGIYSESFKVCIIDFDNSELLKQIGTSINMELTEETSFNGNRSYIEGNTTTENIVLQLCRTDGKAWDEGLILEVYNWLFQEDFKRFQTVDYSSGYNLCYYLKAVNFKKFLNNNFYGYLEVEFMSYSPYCYSIPTSNLRLSRGGSGTINNYSNLYKPYKPKIKIRAYDGNTIKITNNTNNSFVEVRGLNSNETVIVDCSMGTVINSSGTNRFSVLQDYNLLKLNKGNNNISLTGNADIEFICEFPVII